MRPWSGRRCSSRVSESSAIVHATRAPLVTALDVAAGQTYGEEPFELPPATVPPLRALERVLAGALARPPCLIAFSGGRDSSALLAVAVRVAREEALEPPIAITNRFRDAPATAEDDWQELVIKHLAVVDWERIDYGSELDLVGPVATRVLARHGQIFPPNIHSFVPLLERAKGGTLVNGLEGDLFFGAWRWATLAAVRARRRRSQPRDLLRVMHAYAPGPVRRAVSVRRSPGPPLAWLTDSTRGAVSDLRARHQLTQPLRFDSYVRWAASRRAMVLMRRQLDRLAEDADAVSLHAFYDPDFLAGLAAAGGRDGFGDRTATMRWLFADQLPEAAIARPGKARFDAAYYNDHSRALAMGWDGTGFDPALVRADELRIEWHKPVADFRTAMLLQALWLNRHSGVAA
jgi:hypothetical protein